MHPVWRTVSAYFVTLELMEEPLPDYVRYRFSFWEDSTASGGLVEVPVEGSQRAERTRRFPPEAGVPSIQCGKEKPCGGSPGGTAWR